MIQNYERIPISFIPIVGNRVCKLDTVSSVLDLSADKNKCIAHVWQKTIF